MQQEHLPPAPEGTVPEDEVLYALADSVPGLWRLVPDRVSSMLCTTPNFVCRISPPQCR